MRTCLRQMLALVLCLAACGGRNEPDRVLSAPKKPFVRAIPGVQFEAEYKFTGLKEGTRTQLAWKYSILVYQQSLPPYLSPPKRKLKGRTIEVPYDRLCVTFAYRLVDADGFMLESHEIAQIPVFSGVIWSGDVQLWVNKDAAVRTDRIVGKLALKWAKSCFNSIR